MVPRWATLDSLHASTLRYRIVGGAQGIGINQQGSAYAQFQLVRIQKKSNKLGDTDRVLLSGMLQAEFSDESNKIISVKIFSLSEMNAVNNEIDPKTLRNAYPSVVSLDPLHLSMSHAETATNESTDDGLKHDIENTTGGDNGDFFII